MEGDIIHSLLTENFFNHGFEALTKWVEMYATLSTTNAGIERGFCCMKRIKTDFGNKLSGEAPRSSDASLTGEDIKM